MSDKNEDWNNKSNNEIITELEELKQKHENLKTKIINDYDELERIEKIFNEGNDVLLTRLNKKDNKKQQTQ